MCYNLVCRFLKKLCQIWGLNQKMEIFIIRSTHVKPKFFKTLGILKCKKKCEHKIFLKSIFLWALQFILVWQIFIAFFHYKQLWWLSCSFAKKIFPHIQETYFDAFFPAESIGTLGFAFRARFSGVWCNYSVLYAKKIEKIQRI